MTEAEWLASDDPERMLYFLRTKASKRKRRLFACACVRRVWYNLHGERARRAMGLVMSGRSDRPPACRCFVLGGARPVQAGPPGPTTEPPRTLRPLGLALGKT